MILNFSEAVYENVTVVGIRIKKGGREERRVSFVCPLAVDVM